MGAMQYRDIVRANMSLRLDLLPPEISIIPIERNGRWLQFSQDAQFCNVLSSSTKTFRSARRPDRLTSAFYSLPVYAGNDATLAQSRRDTVGTVPFRESAHIQWKSTGGRE